MRASPTFAGPVAIGGIGGSGTRVVAALIEKLGFDLGPDLNAALDSQIFSLLFKRRELWPLEENAAELRRAWLAFHNGLVRRAPWTGEEQAWLRSLAATPRPNLPVDWLAWRVKVLLDQSPADPPSHWGWKEPNTHIVLPALNRLVPTLRYIHVMRHGLDMAFSDNQEQLLYWAEPLLGEPSPPVNPETSLRYWCAAQRRVLSARDTMGDRFLLLDFDRFCRDPARHLPTLLAFVGAEAAMDRTAELTAGVAVPPSTGRHRRRDTGFVTPAQRALLTELGYPA